VSEPLIKLIGLISLIKQKNQRDLSITKISGLYLALYLSA